MHSGMLGHIPNSLVGAAVLPKWFSRSAAIILVVTGVAKLWSTVGDSGFLGVPDPIFGMQFRHLLFAVATVELIVAGVCLFCGASQLGPILVAWLATSFLVYRLGLVWMDWKRPCSCLGNLTDALHIPPHAADTFMKAVLVYLLVGSYGLLFLQWRNSSRR